MDIPCCMTFLSFHFLIHKDLRSTFSIIKKGWRSEPETAGGVEDLESHCNSRGLGNAICPSVLKRNEDEYPAGCIRWSVWRLCGVVAILGCQLDFMWNKPRRNGGHTSYDLYLMAFDLHLEAGRHLLLM